MSRIFVWISWKIFVHYVNLYFRIDWITYLNADLVMNAPPVNMNIESTNAKVKSNLLNNVILLDIDLSVKQVKIFPTNPKDPTIQTDIPEE